MIAHYDYTAGVERKQYEGLRLAELSGLVDDKDIVLVLNKTPHVGGGCAGNGNRSYWYAVVVADISIADLG